MGSFGLYGNIGLGVAGAVAGTLIGGILSPAIGMAHTNPVLGTAIWSVVGAAALLGIVGKVKKAI